MKQNMPSKTLEALKRGCSAIYSYLFYIPCGGEAAFRERCMKFADLKYGERILDLCCGTGELTTVIDSKQFASELVGVDIDDLSIAMARIKPKRGPISFITASVGNLPLRPSSFHKCFISLGLHHMTLHERQKTLAEIHQTLTSGGTLCIIDYNLPIWGPRRLIASIFAKIDESSEAYNMIKNGNLIEEIKIAGFEITRRRVTCQGIIQMIAAMKISDTHE
jgi:ubiquinone/menaquinone biosynthesis C-methylase UbiE